MTLEHRLAEIELEWLKLRLYFVPYDRYVSHELNNGRRLEDVLESLIAYDSA